MNEYETIGELAVNWLFWFVLGTGVAFIILTLWDRSNGKD